MSSIKKYSPLITLVNEGSLPEVLSFLKPVVEAIVRKIHYRYFSNTCSGNGSQQSLSIELLLDETFEFDLFGNGFRLMLFPDSQKDMTTIPMSLDYSCPIIGIIRNFSPEHFSYSTEAMFDVFDKFVQMSDNSYAATVISLFCGGENIDAIKLFVDNINAEYGLFQSDLIPYPTESEYSEMVASVVMSINEHPDTGNTHEVINRLYFNPSTDDFFNNLNTLSIIVLNKPILEYIKGLIVPHISATLDNIGIGLVFPRKVLSPIDPDVESSILRFDAGTLRFDSENGISFDADMSVSLNTQSQIGNTGLSVEITNARLDISKDGNIVEADMDGRASGFVGVYVERAAIGLPAKWFRQEAGQTLSIFGEKMLIGTGGFSGTIGLEADDGHELTEDDALRCLIGGENGIEIGFRHFDLTLKQGMFTGTNIGGYIVIPKLKDAKGKAARIDMTAGVSQDGDWFFTASETEGIRLRLGEVLNFDLRALSVGQEDGRFYVSMSCGLSFGEAVTDKITGLQSIGLNDFRIWQDGKMELPTMNGALSLKKPVTIRLFGKAEFTITAIHFGSEKRMKNGEEREYMFLGLDCGLNTGLGGVEAKGNGLKFYFTTDTESGKPFDCFVKIQGINVNLTIPGDDPDHAAVIINGYLQLIEEKNRATGNAELSAVDEGPEYIGGINMALPKLQFAIDANMRLKPKKPSFLIDVDVDMPVCIPLGPTGAGIYGFRGLTGLNYVASKKAAGLKDTDPWWQYYKAKVAPDYKEGVQVSKFSADDDGFSLGAGVSLATAFDSGRIFSAKLFMMLSLPDVFLLEGQGAILRERIGLDTTNDPPFYAMVAVSDESIETALGLDVSFPDSGDRKGWLAKVSGRSEIAFYWGDAAAWHIYLGRQTPEEQRIQAKVLNWFYAYMYLMIDKTGIRTGAGAGFDFGLYLDKKKRVGIEANAYIDLAGRISFQPMQLGGAISVGGGACIKIFMFKLGIQLGFALAAEAPRPYNVEGEISIKFELPWPIEKLGGPYKLKFGRKHDKEFKAVEIPLLDSNSAKAVNMQTGEQFAVVMSTDANVPAGQIPLIPVDSYIDVEFKKGMGCNAGNILSIGEGYINTELVPPQAGPSGQLTHTFLLETLDIEIRNGSVWTTYKPHEALKPNAQSVNPYQAGMAWGYWQCISPGVHNKLRLYARSPLNYMNRTLKLRPENLGYEEGFLLCRGTARQKKQIRFDRTKFTTIAKNKRAWIDGALFAATTYEAEIVPERKVFTDNIFINNAMASSGNLEIKFTERIYNMTLYYSTAIQGTKIVLYNGSDLVREYAVATATGRVYSIDIPDTGVDRAILYTPETTDYRILTENGALLQTESGLGLVTENCQAYREVTLLYGIDILPERDYLYNKNIPSLARVREQVGIMDDGFKRVPQPVWRPNSMYRIALVTSDKITGKNIKDTYPDNKHQWYIYFRTAGPIGFYSTEKKNRIIEVDNYSTLLQYIDFKHSYPAVDGQLTDAKPMYYNDNAKINLVFLNDYMDTIYRNYLAYQGNAAVSYDLQLTVSECTDGSGVQQRAQLLYDAWSAIDSREPGNEISTINNLLQTKGRCEKTSPDECTEMEKITPQQKTFVSTLNGLKAGKLYSAVYTVSNGAVTSAPVHEFVFRTSVFASFDEQIGGFVNEDGSNNLFEIPCSMDSVRLSELRSAVSNNDDLKQLLPETVGIQSLPPSENMEVNVLRNTDKSCIGLLIRSVEPIFDPRIDISELKRNNAITVTPAGNIETAYSGDRTMALIVGSAAPMPSGNYTIQFKNLVYDVASDTYVANKTKDIKFDI